MGSIPIISTIQMRFLRDISEKQFCNIGTCKVLEAYS
jgi:hypothetical protein